MKLILDATALLVYPFAQPGFAGGTELATHTLAAGLAKRGHLVHVVCPDLAEMEERAERLYYWPKEWHPTSADAVVMIHNLENIAPYSADLLLLMSNGLGAFLGPDDEYATGVDGIGCLSQYHIDVLCQEHPRVKRETCFVTGLGVDLKDYLPSNLIEWGDTENGPWTAMRAEFTPPKIPGRLIWTSDPQRGLWHALDIFDRVKVALPDATLHVTYDFEKQFAYQRWNASAMAQTLWECRQRLLDTPGVVNRGGLSREDLIKEQLEAQILLFPCDVVRQGSQLHSLAVLEAAAAGCALVLSDAEALPELFTGAASVLPVPGTFDPMLERRISAQDWADEIVDVLQDRERWDVQSRAAQALAEEHTWERFIDAWDVALTRLAGTEAVSA